MKRNRDSFGFITTGFWLLVFVLIAMAASAEAGAVYTFASQLLGIF